MVHPEAAVSAGAESTTPVDLDASPSTAGRHGIMLANALV